MPTSKAKTLSEDSIIEKYMSYVLDQEEVPTNVYKFCKESKIPEGDFYNHFGSLKNIDKRIWEKLFTSALETIKKDKTFEASNRREKMLSLFYTFFENLTLNRSYILFTYASLSIFGKRNALSHMRSAFIEFVSPMFDKEYEKGDFRNQVKKVTRPTIVESLWGQMLFLIDFWQNDSSRGFEKTDAAIEKSVRAAFDIIDTTPLESVFDFGRFLWKERMVK